MPRFDINPLLPIDTTVNKFLAEMHHTGYGYHIELEQLERV